MTALPATERAHASGLPLLVVALSLGLALGAPLWTLLLGPIVFGVPHVLGDLRVLWLQRPAGLTARIALAVAVPIAALTLVRLAATAGAGSWPRLELACGVLAIAVGGLAGASSIRARVLVGAACLLLLSASAIGPALVVVLVAHVHNLVAVGWYAARAGRSARTALALFAAALVAVWFAPVGPEAATAAGLTWARCSADLAPGLDAATADRLVRSFAFAQVVHYGLWTFVLPAQGGRSWREELGPAGLRASLLACAIVPLLALVDANGARSAYLALAIGHGWFELAVGAHVLARRGAIA